MKTMKKRAAMLALLLSAGVTAASAQEPPTSDETYDFILSKIASDDGRYDEALAKIDKLVAKHPDNTALLYERAMVRIDAGKRDDAEIDLRKAVAGSPNFYDAHRVLGRLLLDRAGNDRAVAEDALTQLSAAYKLNPDDLVSGIAVAQIYGQLKRPADAEKVLATLLERAPDQRALNYNYAIVLSQLGRSIEAKEYLEKTILLDATFSPAVQQLVELYQRDGDWLKAASLLTPLIAADPANVDFERQQGYFYLRGGEPEKARATFKHLVDTDLRDTRSEFYLAESLNDLRQFVEADKIYHRLLEKSPDDPDVQASLGLSQIGQRKWDEAKKSFQLVLANTDASENLQVLSRTQLALIDLQKGLYANAVEGARPAFIFHDKPNSQAISIALDALKKEKKYNEAVVLLAPLASKYPDDPFVSTRYVEVLMRAGEKEKAQQVAAAQAKLGPKFTISVAEALLQDADYPQAITLLKDGLQSNGADVDMKFELASAYERSGDREAAEKIFLDILKAQPDHASTLNYLGYMYAESGTNLDRAQDMITHAVRLEPRNGAYVDSLGWLYFRQGKLDLAEKYLTDATHLLPNDATVHEHLGDVFAKRGDYHKALDLYRTALTLEPEAKDEAKLRSKIAEVEKQTQR